MMEKVFSAIVALTIGALLVQCLCAVLWSLLHELGRWLQGPLSVLAAVFLIGAAAQILTQRRGRDARIGRERKAEERFIRQSVRRPAISVPSETSNAKPDHDPAVNVGDEDEEDLSI